ncbi:FkbM family methyltransferase [Motilibacter aurantiacus]|uniref:FkbM family methyltransferase n=1 Tax=Motilibacter aurantiacus TaxID=2714955 RepID=UPI00140E8193|nr:FkbM family methyltransferase [Motilibacter aurantiacus]
MAAPLSYYPRLLRAYWKETGSPASFARLLRVRLARSKGIGRLAFPRPGVAEVQVRSLGGRVALRSHSTDVSVLGELVVSDGYEPVVRLLPPPSTIVDLGANTGLAARWLLGAYARAGGRPRLLAVEPEPGNLEVLRRNVAGLPEVAVAPVAVAADAREVTLRTTSGEHGFTMLGDGPGGVRVPARPLADLLEEHGFAEVGLLKVDIEGGEREVFADCSPWIGRVRSMVVECHAGYTVEALLADLERGGGAFEVLDVDRKPAWGFEVAVLRAV